MNFVFRFVEFFIGISYLIVGISGESISTGPIPKGLGLLAALSKSSDPKLALTGDPATIAARPFTAPLATESRGPAPPRSDIGIPDPFVVQREAKLPVIPPDTDPPAPSFGSPERPYLPLEGVKKE